jgi:putative protease
MVTAACVLRAMGECAGACAACSRRTRTWWLEDRKGYRFPLLVDAVGRSRVFNSRALDLSHALDDVLATGAAAIRADLVLEDPTAAGELVAALRSRLDAALAGGPPPADRLLEPSTTGHAFRGVA